MAIVKTVTTRPTAFFSQRTWFWNKTNLAPDRNLSSLNRLCSYNDVLTTTHDPDWRVKVAQHIPATNGYVKNVTTSEQPGFLHGKCSYTDGTYGLGDITGHIAFVQPSGSTFDGELQTLALTRIRRKMLRNLNQAALAAPLAEIRELRGLVRQTAEMSVDFLRALIQAKRTKGRSFEKFAADAWLGFNFGLRPLVLDTKAAAESVVSFLERENELNLRVTSGADMDWRSSYVDDSSRTGIYGAYLRFKNDTFHSCGYRYFTGYNLLVNNDTDYSLWEHLGLTWGSLPGVAWELTPFSWVLDYFTNLSTIFDDMFWSPPGAVTYVGYSRRYTAITTQQMFFSPNTSKYKLSEVEQMPAVIKRFEFSRVPLSPASLNHLGFRFKTSDEVGLSAVTKLLNLAAVFKQLSH